MRRGERALGGARGFTYIGLLALIALIGIMLAAAGEVTRTAMQREREADLLWVGRQYRTAIGRYVVHNRRYPATLEELVGPPAAEGGGDAEGAATPTFRALRRLYRDPMTNAVDWTTVRSPDGGIMGVASTSARVPIKVAGFEPVEEEFEKAETYAQWTFIHSSKVASRASRRPVSQ